jgi:hypothetical protein
MRIESPLAPGLEPCRRGRSSPRADLLLGPLRQHRLSDPRCDPAGRRQPASCADAACRDGLPPRRSSVTCFSCCVRPEPRRHSGEAAVRP